MSRQLEAILRRSGTLSIEELELSVVQAHARNVPLWDIVVGERQVSEHALAEALSRSLKVPRVRFDSIQIEAAAVKTVSGRIARQYTCLPVRLDGKALILAMANPLNRQAIQDVQFMSGRNVQPVVAVRTEILNGIEVHYPRVEAPVPEPKAPDEYETFAVASGEQDVLDLDDNTSMPSIESGPAVVAYRQMILDALKWQASDIHVEPGPHDVRVRLRIDGVLRDYVELPRWMHNGLLSRIKVLAKLDIAERRVPQDGRSTVRTRDRTIDMRVSTLPTQFGEKAALRLVGSAGSSTLESLGLSSDEMTLLDDGLQQPQGLILVTGPTGSGKSTTLYSMLMRRQSPEVNIVTIEDPIEYHVPGANQVQVNPKARVTFASCLRAILRQDPDVIMVGEIRDLETAEIAFQAALTGHLVLSTLHTNGSVAAITRLLDLGVKPLMLSAVTNLVVAQRLARRVCMNCSAPYVPSADTLRRLRIRADQYAFHRGMGCEACGRTGYSGRVGIFEMLKLTPRLKEAVSQRSSESEIRRAAIADGTRFLLGDALDKMSRGLTTADEILRVIRIEDADEHAGAQPAMNPSGADSSDLVNVTPVRYLRG